MCFGVAKMSKLSAFFEKKKKKITKVTAPPEITQVVEQPVEPLGAEEDAGWGVEPQQEAAWGVAPTGSSTGGLGGDGSFARSLRVSAVGAYEIESKRDKSWSAMKKLEEEQRRGLQALREEEAREMQQQQQQQQGNIENHQEDTVAEGETPTGTVDTTTTPQTDTAGVTENKPWVSARVLRALEGGSLLRKSKIAPVPSFEGDPDLATAVQMSTKQHHPSKKDHSNKRTPTAISQNEESGRPSPSVKGESDTHQQQPEENIMTSRDEKEEQTGDFTTTLRHFDIQKFVSFKNVSGTVVPFDDELVRAKYETRSPWASLTVGEA